MATPLTKQGEQPPITIQMINPNTCEVYWLPKTFDKRYPEVTDVRLMGIGIQIGDISRIAKEKLFPNISCLSLSPHCGSHTKDLYLLQDLPIQIIRVDNCAVDREAVRHFNQFPKLTKLSLAKSTGLNADVLLTLNHPSLESLDLTDCPEATDNNLQKLLLNCPKLKEINITGCTKITDLAKDLLSKTYPALRIINLKDKTAERRPDALPDTDLKTSDAYAKSLQKLSSAQESAPLSTANVNKSAIATSTPAPNAVYTLEKIVDFIRVSGPAITPGDITNLAPEIRQNIQHLQIDERCLRSTNDVRKITSLFPSVKAVTFSRNCKETLNGQIHYLSSLPIERIDVTSAEIYAEGFVNFSRFLKLQRLILSQCKYHIPPESFQHLNSPTLVDLDLSGCQVINSVGLEHLSNGCPNLQSLNLTNCSQITDDSLLHLKNFPLNRLMLKGCKISAKGIEWLRQAFPNATIISDHDPK